MTGLLNTANAQDGEGRYLFAGNLVQTRPFVLAGNVHYAGDAGTRSQRVADTRTVQEGDPGSAVFMNIPGGNGAFTVTGNAANAGTASWSSATVKNGTPFVPGKYTLEFTAPDTWEAGTAPCGSRRELTRPANRSVSRGPIEFQGTPAAVIVSASRRRARDVFKNVQGSSLRSAPTPTPRPAGNFRAGST